MIDQTGCIERITFGDLTINTLTRVAEWKGQKIHFTKAELVLFSTLLLHGRANHTELYIALYGNMPRNKFEAFDSIGPIVNRIRNKLPFNLIISGKKGSREYLVSAGARS